MSENKSQVARAELDIPSWILFKEKKKCKMMTKEVERKSILVSKDPHGKAQFWNYLNNGRGSTPCRGTWSETKKPLATLAI